MRWNLGAPGRPNTPVLLCFERSLQFLCQGEGMIGTAECRTFLLWFLSVIALSIGRAPGGYSQGQSTPRFDGQRAYEYLVEQCNFGPRNPGSEGHRRAKGYLLETLGQYAPSVTQQPFTHYDRKAQQVYHMANIMACFGPTRKRRILLAAHWDTRPYAERDPDPQNWNRPILGANDGASAVAVLLELARCFKAVEPEVGVDIVLFDGEDFGEKGHSEDYLLGSKHFAHYEGDYNPEFGILLDMVGDQDLVLYAEGYSVRYAPEVVDMVWGTAEAMGLVQFQREVKYTVEDDHLSLIAAGMRCIDIIDFDYPFWHTLEDTPDKCSPESLQTIGDLLIEVIYNRLNRSGSE